MLHWMRRHMRIILIVTTIIVVPTFVVWGGYGGKAKRGKGGVVQEDTVIVSVAGVPIKAHEYTQRLRDEAARATRYGGESKTMAQLRDDGTAERVLSSLIDAALLRVEADKLGVDIDQDYLVETLKKDPSFQDENGKFSPMLWNTFLDSNERQNWNEIYSSVRTQLARSILLQRVMASARVLDSDIRKKFEENHTKIQVKYVAVDPEIVPTDEQIQAEYDKNPKRYEIPEKRDVQFVCVSTVPPVPPLVNDLTERLRNGENFSELAKQYSEGPEKEDGGNLGWLDVPGPDEVHDLQVLFATPVGTISPPVFLDGSYHIYTIEEERTDSATGKRSVSAREIVVRAALEEAEENTRKEKAQRIATKAKESGDLQAAAAEAGLTVLSATGLSRDRSNISGMVTSDARAIGSQVAGVALDQVSDVIEGAQGFYVAKVTRIIPAVPQPIEAVRDKVKEDTINTIRRSPERRAELKRIGDEIAAKAKTIQEVVDLFPDRKFEIKETREFKRRDFMFSEGIYFQPNAVFDAVGDKEPGAFAGPIQGMRGESYFVELVKKAPPTDEEWANEWPKEEKQLRDTALATRKNELLMDYLADLRERAVRENSIERNNTAIEKILSAGEQEEEPAPADTTETTATTGESQTGEAQPDAAAPAPAVPAADTAPAPSDAAAEPNTAAPASQ